MPVKANATAGAMNLAHFKAESAEIEVAVAKLRAELVAKLGPTVTQAQEASIASAAALYRAILSTSRRLQSTNSRASARIALQSDLPRLASSLQRCLRSLGALSANAKAADAMSGPPPNATPSEARAWSRQYVAHVLAGPDKSQEPTS